MPEEGFGFGFRGFFFFLLLGLVSAHTETASGRGYLLTERVPRTDRNAHIPLHKHWLRDTRALLQSAWLSGLCAGAHIWNRAKPELRYLLCTYSPTQVGALRGGCMAWAFLLWDVERFWAELEFLLLSVLCLHALGRCCR